MTVGIYEAKQKLNSLVADIELSGEDVTLTRHGKPVAKIVRLVSEDEHNDRKDAIHNLMNFAKVHGTTHAVTHDEVKDMIREDRESH